MNFEEYSDTTFAIVTNYGDLNDVVLATGLENALKAFLQSQKILTSLLSEHELVITGQEDDLTMPLLSVYWNKQTVLSLNTVSYCDGTSVVEGKLKDTNNLPLVKGCDSLVELAYKLNKVYELNSSDELKQSRFDAVSRSWPARHITQDYFTAELTQFEENTVSMKTDFDVKAFSNEIDSIRVSYSTTVRVS